MERKKKILIITGAIILIVIICVVYSCMKGGQEEQSNEITEYTPQQEISEEQLRQTIVTLYFKNEEELVPEARLIDVKVLLTNPYEQILELLIGGPKNEKWQKTIPEGTKLNKIEKQKETLIIDFSKEFIENHVGGEKEERLTIQSIVKTLTELTEINETKILIDGEENRCFKDEKIKFDEIFVRD